MILPGGTSYRFIPGDPAPGRDNYEARQCHEKARDLTGAAQRAGDLFVRADNSPQDSDLRDGFVRLRNVSAPGLLEKDTETISGLRTPEGDLSVEANGFYTKGHSSLIVSDEKREITMERPMYSNGMYAPTIEQLSVHGDGTQTLSWTYAPPI